MLLNPVKKITKLRNNSGMRDCSSLDATGMGDDCDAETLVQTYYI